MAQTNVQLNLKEIYERLCPKCKEKLRALVKEKITDDIVSKALEQG